MLHDTHKTNGRPGIYTGKTMVHIHVPKTWVRNAAWALFGILVAVIIWAYVLIPNVELRTTKNIVGIPNGIELVVFDRVVHKF